MKSAIDAPAMPTVERNTLTLVLGLLVAVLAVMFRMGIMTEVPEFDELYHLLAARSWNDVGTLAILDGEYTRGALYTKAVAATMALTGGDDLTSARTLSLIVGILTPVLVFLGVTRIAGLPVALIVAVYMILWPQGILESQSLRFYGVQVLFFLIGTYGFYRAFEPEGQARIMWGLLAIAGWIAAFHFQITSIVGIAGAFAGMTCIVIVEKVTTLRGRIMVFGGLLALAAAVLALAAVTGILERAWAFYRWTPGHAEALRDYVGFYHKQFENRYGLMWWSIPLWAAIALYARPRLAFFCLSVFFTCFLVHSGSGMKSLRYLSYASPMLFIVWGIAFVWLWEQLAARAGHMIAGVVAAVAAVAMLTLSDFPTRSLNFAQGDGYSHRDDWRGARGMVGDWIDAPFKVTNRELHMVNYIGDYDMVISTSRVSELVPPVDFTPDFRTGRATIGAPDAIAAVFACERDGLMVTSHHWWDNAPEAQALQDLIATAGLQTETRRGTDLIAIRWQDPTAATPDCSGVPQPAQ